MRKLLFLKFCKNSEKIYLKLVRKKVVLIERFSDFININYNTIITT